MPDGALSDEITFLNDLADDLCRDVAGGAGNTLVYVKESIEGRAFDLLPLNGIHPASVLLGAVAPPDWVALGVATRGRPFSLDGDQRQTIPASASVAVIVHRDGPVIGRVRIGDTVHVEPPAYGLTLDCLQRTFGLPTAAPLVPVGARYTMLWLENVITAARRSPATLTWAEVVALHPAAQILADDGTGGIAAHELIPAALAIERRCDWERLRWLVVEGAWQEPDVTPVDAAWLDEGSFSRMVLGEVVSVRQALGEVRRTAGPAIARRCRSVVHQLKIRAGGDERPSRGSAA